MHPVDRPFPQQLRELLVGGGGLVGVVRGKPEVLFAAAQHPEPLQTVQQDEHAGGVGVAGLGAARELPGQLGHGLGHLAPGHDPHLVGQVFRQPRQETGVRRIGGGPVEDPQPRVGRPALGGQADGRHRHHGQGRLVALADDDDVAAAVP